MPTHILLMRFEAHHQVNGILSISTSHLDRYTVLHAHHFVKQGYIPAKIQGSGKTEICRYDHNFLLMEKALLRVQLD